MEARTLLQKIRQRGFTIAAIGNDISLAPKKLLNDRMISFVREHKEAIITALYHEQDERQALHLERKRALRQGRLEVLRLILRRFLKTNSGSSIISSDEAEEFLDGVLRHFKYDPESTIDYYRSITLKPAIVLAQCVKCGYIPMFCLCLARSRLQHNVYASTSVRS